MKNYLINLKPIPIFKAEKFYNCSDKEIECLKSFEHFENTGHDNYITNDNIFTHAGLHKLRDAITDKFHYFTKEVIGINNEFKLERNWSTFNSKGQHHGEHTHPNIVFAAVFYARCKTGVINLKTDNNRTSITEAFNFSYEKNKDTVYNSDMWRIPVSSGDLVVFPGHIVHYGDPHPDESERIMIGTNWFPRGKFYTNTGGIEWLEL